MRLNPKFAKAWDNLGWLQATCTDAAIRNPQEAITSAQRACELTKFGEWSFIHTLAAAYAEAGDFTKAQELSARVEGMAPAEEKPAIKKLTELYRAGQTSRQ